MINNLILFDGMSGSGKGSRIITLDNFLNNDLGKKIITFNEPKYLREEIKEYKKNPARDAMKETELFIRSRKLGLQDYEIFLNNDDFAVIGDRSFISNYVYQSLQGISLEKLKDMNSFYPDPATAFILLCDPEVALNRIHERQLRDGIEISLDETMEKITRLRDKYIEVAKDLPYAHVINTNGRAEAIDLVLRSHIKGLYGIDMSKAVFLDKDGTLVEDSGYPNIIPTDKIFSDSYNELRKIQDKGYNLFIVSSQPWVARGRMSSLEVKAVFDSVVNKYRAHGVNIVDYGYCEHSREDNCPDKKPSTRLFEGIIKKYNIDTRNSYMVGDMDNDILAGQNIGLTTIRINNEHPNKISPDYNIKDIKDLSSYIK